MVDKSIDHTAEAELVAGLQRHDHGAFGKFVTQYSGWLKHIARTMLGDQDDAEEVVQEVLLIVYRACGALRRRLEETRGAI